MKTTEKFLNEGHYKGYEIRKSNLSTVLSDKKTIQIWDCDCKCVQQLSMVLFSTERSIQENSMLDDNHRLVHVDCELKIITDIEIYQGA